MKRLHFVLLIFVLIIAVACAPNRLEDSLEDEGAGAVDEGFVAAPRPDGRSLQPQLEGATIDLDEVVALLPPDAIPAVLPDEVPEIMVSAAEAEAAGIAPDVRVIGVSINGDSRAYPIPYMSAHEVVNDVVGGEAVAVTW